MTLPNKLSEAEFRDRVSALIADNNLNLNSESCSPRRTPNGVSNRMYVFAYLDVHRGRMFTVRCRDCEALKHADSQTMVVGVSQGDTEASIVDCFWTIYEVWKHLYR